MRLRKDRPARIARFLRASSPAVIAALLAVAIPCRAHAVSGCAGTEEHRWDFDDAANTVSGGDYTVVEDLGTATDCDLIPYDGAGSQLTTDNGREAVYLDGSAENYQCSATWAAIAQDVTVLVAFKWDGPVDPTQITPVLWDGTDGVEPAGEIRSAGSPTNFRANAGISCDLPISDDTEWKVVRATYNTTSSSLAMYGYSGNDQSKTCSMGSSGINGGFVLGSAYNAAGDFRGTIGEVIVTSDATDVTCLESYLQTKWHMAAPTATPTTVSTSTPTNTPLNTSTPTHTPTVTPTPTITNTPTTTPTTGLGIIAELPTTPESWWYDRAKMSGPTLTTVNGVATYTGVCGSVGCRWHDNVTLPTTYAGDPLRVRLGAYKMATTASTGTLTLACKAQCVSDGDPVSATFGSEATDSADVSLYARYDRIELYTGLMTPSGTCTAGDEVFLACRATAMPASPGLYPFGGGIVEVLD